MDNTQWRALAALVISLVILLFWEYFVVVPGPKAPVPAPLKQQEQHQVAEPAPAPKAPAAEEPVAQIPPAKGEPAPAHPARDIVVTTDLYRAVFTEQGAKLKSFQLFKYRETVDKNSPPKQLVRAQKPADLPLNLALLQPALNTGGDLYTASATGLNLRSGGPQHAELDFALTTPDGVRVIKRFEFRRDLYRINMQVVVQNLSGKPLEVEPALSLASAPFSTNDGHYQQAAVLVGDKVETTAASKLEKPKIIRGNVRWAASDQPFFVAALAPSQGEAVHAKLWSTGDVVRESLIGPPQKIGADRQHVYKYSLYYGPKEMKILSAQGLGLDKIIEYGWFDVIAKPLLVVLNFIDGFTHNYGWAIIVLTVLIKLLFWPLSQKGYRSMKEMQKLQPKLVKLKEKYKDDPKKLNEEMLNLYRSYKVNPMGGCLPMLAQIPVFFALYRVLQYSLELRHAPFLGWINDLSAPDRLNIGIHIPAVGGLPVLTLLMGASMYIQQRMTPMGGDPTQAKMMQLLPIVFTFMFIYFPSGLVLYWLTNNVLSIGQQYYINRHMD